ncbi:riboflavin kinase [Gymnopus androsaceus JB14]|uniref:Riboflavin kinase n=1 Tax=Gymnopus androsaceus JB14 TaxID=1447944 RepID=A0A6A4IBJ3_9AGAR|nr:riboflavin kinase [Gymnopus androsaceus JB14]
MVFESTPPEISIPQSLSSTRPLIVGPPSPSLPYPIRLQGPVMRGFGRGGKDLGCPTANLPDDAVDGMLLDGVKNSKNSTDRVPEGKDGVGTGVYYGYARVYPPESAGSEAEASRFKEEDKVVLPMVMSLGWNPFYKNERLTAEIHILHSFASDFYGYQMKALVLGYIRPELDYTTREGLIQDINTDKRVALNCLDRPGYSVFAGDEFFDSIPTA